jgi:hypothetical protein
MPKAVLQNPLIYNYLGYAEIEWDFVWIQIMQSNCCGAREDFSLDGNRVCEMHYIGPIDFGQPRKLCVIPNVPAKCSLFYVN